LLLQKLLEAHRIGTSAYVNHRYRNLLTVSAEIVLKFIQQCSTHTHTSMYVSPGLIRSLNRLTYRVGPYTLSTDT